LEAVRISNASPCSQQKQPNKTMKKSISLLATVAALALCLPVANRAATQVYDLKTDWSDTQNPNGPWSYRSAGGSLLPNDSFPWGYMYVDGIGDALIKTTEATVLPGHRELGDVVAYPMSEGVMARWTAPARGTINISGVVWNAGGEDNEQGGAWRLTHNGVALRGGIWGGGGLEYRRSSPFDLSLGSGGPNALLNVLVEAGDHVELMFPWLLFNPVGVNFTIILTMDSVDPVAAIEDLAITVCQINLQNGIENSLDSKLDAAVNALVDANENNDGAACNSLAAFISAVEAQRAKKITNAQADQLIASAQQIRDMLDCVN
jgi:hypothetical protein